MTDLSAAATPDLRRQDFGGIRDLLYRVCGIDLNDGKEGLVQTRLAKRLRALGLEDFRAYLEYVRGDDTGAELSTMVDLLTTNKTDFFREPQHFGFLRAEVLPKALSRGGPLRFWSAGCSSGEEPYTLAMVLREAVPDLDRRDARILATDISSTVLDRAREGVYSSAVLEGVPAPLRKKYFAPAGAGAFGAAASLRGLISFARLNLMGPWPMKGPFEVIFCRNVMIYFDRPTQERLVGRFAELLVPGGYLFTGHSESLNSFRHPYEYVQPAVYRLPGGER